jgi:acetoin utilization deacetylase AcuC-like enzyme
LVAQVRRSGAFEGALFAAAGTVAAAVRIWQGEIDNAFVFTGYGDHHAGSDFFGGGCYFNGAAIAIAELRKRFGAKRFAIVDTDAHHGDGTWDLFEKDSDVLYVCLCQSGFAEENNKVNIPVPWPVNDEEYLELVKREFVTRARAFAPEAIFWNWGYDGTQGEYGDIGLTPRVHARLAMAIKEAADEFCQGRLIVVLCGGSQRGLARLLIPQVVEVLATEEAPPRLSNLAVAVKGICHPNCQGNLSPLFLICSVDRQAPGMVWRWCATRGHPGCDGYCCWLGYFSGRGGCS